MKAGTAVLDSSMTTQHSFRFLRGSSAEEGQRRRRRSASSTSGAPVEEVVLQVKRISEGERHEESRLRTHHRVPDAASREGQSGQLSAHDMRAPTTLKYM